jgi:hypothetical protein
MREDRSTAAPGPADVVAAALRTLWPGRFGDDLPPEHASLGKGGLDLDSIEIAELVIECEERAGLPGSRATQLLEAGPVTVGRLLDHLAPAR